MKQFGWCQIRSWNLHQPATQIWRPAAAMAHHLAPRIPAEAGPRHRTARQRARRRHGLAKVLRPSLRPRNLQTLHRTSSDYILPPCLRYGSGQTQTTAGFQQVTTTSIACNMPLSTMTYPCKSEGNTVHYVWMCSINTSIYIYIYMCVCFFRSSRGWSFLLPFSAIEINIYIFIAQIQSWSRLPWHPEAQVALPVGHE